MLYALPIAAGLLLWVTATLTSNAGWSIALRVLGAVGFAVAVLNAAGVVK